MPIELKIVTVDNHNTTIGRGNADYATFECETPDSNIVMVAVTHNLLTRSGVQLDMLDLLNGSTIIVNDDENRDTGEFTSAEERLENVIDGTWGILTINSANGRIKKSPLYIAETKELTASIQAKLRIEKDNVRKIDAMKRAQERYEKKLREKQAQPASQVTEPQPTETVVDETQAVLESNSDEIPF